MNKDDNENYIWEAGYDKTWEAIKEDNTGTITESVKRLVDAARERRMRESQQSRRLGVMRHLYVVLDTSEAMRASDLRPNRFVFTIKLLGRFVDSFFRLNPVSHLGIITAADRRAQVICFLTSDSLQVKAAINELSLKMEDRTKFGRVPSVTHAAMIAMSQMKRVPHQGSCELLYILGSLTTADHYSIESVTKELCSNNIKCSVVSLAAEVYAFKTLALQTGGFYTVTLNERHFMDEMRRVWEPRLPEASQANLIKINFPLREKTCNGMICSQVGHTSVPSNCHPSYTCPTCKACFCTLPTDCPICSTTSADGTCLSRALRYLRPLNVFDKVAGLSECYACGELSAEGKVCSRKTAVCKRGQSTLSSEDQADPVRWQCPNCGFRFCGDCCRVIQSVLYSCPGCIES